MMSKQKCFLILVSTLFLMVGNSRATVLLSDHFDYPDGQLTASEFMGSPGDDVSGGNWTAHSGETFSDNVDVISGEAQVLNSGSEDVNRSTGATMGAGDKWFFGALVTVNSTRSPGDAINNDYFLHLKDDGFGFRGRIYVDDPNDGANDFTFGLSASSGGQVSKWGDDLAFGQQYTVIGSYDYDTGDSQLWVNPANMSSTSIADSNGAMTAINAISLRQDFIGGTPNNEILIDAVAVGTSFDDVAGALIPEPTSCIALMLAVFGFSLVRRQ